MSNVATSTEECRGIRQGCDNEDTSSNVAKSAATSEKCRDIDIQSYDIRAERQRAMSRHQNSMS